MKKKFFSLALMVLCCVVVSAQQTLNVHRKSGEVARFAFSEKPVVTYSGSNMVIVTCTASVEFPFGEIAEFTFEDSEADGVESPLQVRDEAQGGVQVYNLRGVLVRSSKTGEYNIEGLPQGVYVVKSNSKTYRITKK